MSYNYEYPYVDAGRQNADWMLNEIKTMRKKIDSLMNGDFSEIIMEHFNDIMMACLYDEATENITLQLQYSIVVGDGKHIYNMDESSITIEEGE